MYYYYYYYAAETGKVTITLNFKEKDKSAVSLEQLTDFLNTINELHRRVLFLTQPEYSKESQTLNNIDNLSMLTYHQLEIEKIKRENPFFLTLSFRLVVGGAISYWVLWKILIKICKRYGSDSSNLTKTIQEAFRALESISSKIKQVRIDSKIESMLGLASEQSDYNDSIDKMERIVLSALKNPDFKKYYDFICLNSIMITDFISKFDPENLTDLEDLIDSIKEEEVVFLKDFSDK